MILRSFVKTVWFFLIVSKTFKKFPTPFLRHDENCFPPPSSQKTSKTGQNVDFFLKWFTVTFDKKKICHFSKKNFFFFFFIFFRTTKIEKRLKSYQKKEKQWKKKKKKKKKKKWKKNGKKNEKKKWKKKNEKKKNGKKMFF